MSTLKKLKSWFVVEEDGPRQPAENVRKTTAKAPAAPTTEAATPASTTPSSPAPTAATTEGQINERFTNVLLQAMEKADQPGFDYLEFKKALQNLKKMKMDEGTRFQSAYAMAQSMDISPAQLIASAKHYLSALGAEEQKFGNALQNQKQSQIGNKQLELTNLDKTIIDLEERIKTLQKEIAAAKKKKASTQKGIDAATTKLQRTQNDFRVTYEAITGQIEGDIKRMEEYLK